MGNLRRTLSRAFLVLLAVLGINLSVVHAQRPRALPMRMPPMMRVAPRITAPFPRSFQRMPLNTSAFIQSVNRSNALGLLQPIGSLNQGFATSLFGLAPTLSMPRSTSSFIATVNRANSLGLLQPIGSLNRALITGSAYPLNPSGRHALHHAVNELADLQMLNAASAYPNYPGSAGYINPYAASMYSASAYGSGSYGGSGSSGYPAALNAYQSIPPAAQQAPPDTAASPLAASGIDNVGGRVKWPLGLLVLGSPEAEQQRQRIESLLQTAAEQARTGAVAAPVAQELAQTIEQLRGQLRAMTERAVMAQVTIEEANRFLDRLKKVPG